MPVRPEADEEANILRPLLESEEERVEGSFRVSASNDATIECEGCGESGKEGDGWGEE